MDKDRLTDIVIKTTAGYMNTLDCINYNTYNRAGQNLNKSQKVPKNHMSLEFVGRIRNKIIKWFMDEPVDHVKNLNEIYSLANKYVNDLNKYYQGDSSCLAEIKDSLCKTLDSDAMCLLPSKNFIRAQKWILAASFVVGGAVTITAGYFLGEKIPYVPEYSFYVMGAIQLGLGGLFSLVKEDKIRYRAANKNKKLEELYQEIKTEYDALNSQEILPMLKEVLDENKTGLLAILNNEKKVMWNSGKIVLA